MKGLHAIHDECQRMWCGVVALAAPGWDHQGISLFTTLAPAPLGLFLNGRRAQSTLRG